jgi:hypothetical protein
VARLSIHVEPHDAVGIARHYIRDLVYGANDGVITTFAVVAGVAGGALSHSAVLIVGAANIAADGLSMAIGNFLSIRAHESALEAENLPQEEAAVRGRRCPYDGDRRSPVDRGTRDVDARRHRRCHRSRAGAVIAAVVS